MNNSNSEYSSTNSDESKFIQNNKKQNIIVKDFLLKRKKHLVE